MLQTALADSAGDGADVALSLNVVGGVLLDTWGVASFPWAMALLVALSFAIAWRARTHAFKPGARGAGKPAVAGH